MESLCYQNSKKKMLDLFVQVINLFILVSSIHKVDKYKHAGPSHLRELTPEVSKEIQLINVLRKEERTTLQVSCACFLSHLSGIVFLCKQKLRVPKFKLL